MADKNKFCSQLHTEVHRKIRKEIASLRPESWTRFHWKSFIYRRMKDHSKGLRILRRIVSGNAKNPTITEVNDISELNSALEN